jgi:hypothetical protein
MECWRFTNRLNGRVPIIMAIVVLLVIFTLLYSTLR